MERKKVTPRYSGPESASFWEAIGALPPPHYNALYQLGVALQNLEGQVLKALRDAQEAK